MKYAPIILILILTSCAGWTPADRALLGASWAAAGADYATTTRILNNGGYEMNPLKKLYEQMEKSPSVISTKGHQR